MIGRWLRCSGLVLVAMIIESAAPAAADLLGDEVPLCVVPLRPRPSAPRLAPRFPGTVASESEPNDNQASANFIDLGTVEGASDEVEVSGTLTTPAAVPIAVSEDDGAIPLANPTGLDDDQRVVASGMIGDGPWGTTSGDYDFYEVYADRGQSLTLDVDAAVLGSPLDSYVGIYNSSGTLLALNDDAAGSAGPDSFLRFTAPADDVYFVVVRGFGNGFQTDPFNPGSGRGAASTGFYQLRVERGSAAIDFFSFELRPGDVVGARSTGAAARLSARAPDGTEIIGSAQDVTGIYPSSSPLPGGGVAALSWVAASAGTYALAVSDGAGEYIVHLRAFRPALEQQPIGSRQTLFLDFDGASVDASRLGGSGVRTLSPLTQFLGGWGLSAAEESAAIDAIVDTVRNNFQSIAAIGDNGDFAVSGVAGEFAIEIRNSRDDPDPWGQENVTRVVVGGTIAELGITTIGISEAIDVGNFATAETGVVLLDNLSDPNPGNPNSLNHFPIDPPAGMVDLIGTAIGNAISHEAGHLFGSFHTERSNPIACLMDIGGDLASIIGTGSDGRFGSADDIEVDFAADQFAGVEGFLGTEDTINLNAFGLSTGAGPQVDTPTPSLPPTASATAGGASPAATPTATATASRTPSSPPLTATRTSSPTPPPPGVCAGVPRGDCQSAPRSVMKLSVSSRSPDRNSFEWQWRRGKAERDELGDPLALTSYDLCLYDAGGLRMSLTVAAAGTCAPGQPCWRASRGGFEYRDRGGAQFGIQRVLLRSGVGHARLQLKARGAGLSVPELPLFVPVTVQLVSSQGQCWTARYSLLGGDNLDKIVARSLSP